MRIFLYFIIVIFSVVRCASTSASIDDMKKIELSDSLQLSLDNGAILPVIVEYTGESPLDQITKFPSVEVKYAYDISPMIALKANKEDLLKIAQISNVKRIHSDGLSKLF